VCGKITVVMTARTVTQAREGPADHASILQLVAFLHEHLSR
jgi:hypothetical protein